MVKLACFYNKNPYFITKFVEFNAKMVIFGNEIGVFVIKIVEFGNKTGEFCIEIVEFINKDGTFMKKIKCTNNLLAGTYLLPIARAFKKSMAS
jgi:hypothetical protein